jgi:drug/metabolite transporter (DMT)-like permease
MSSRRAELIGIAIALVSATAFGATAIIAKFAYREGVNVSTLLVARFTLGAVMLWGLVFALRVPRAMTRRDAIGFLALGAFGYATQSRMVFESLKRIPAGTAILLLYAYPAIVAGLAYALGREQFGWRKALVLATGLMGVALVLGKPGEGATSAGVAFALGGAVVYAIYITIVERVMAGVHPLLSSATIVTGAAVSFVVSSTATGQFRPSVGAAGWSWLVLLAFVSITVAVWTFLAAVDRIGPTRASIASTFEPVVAVALGALTLGERLGAWQLAGGALVIAAVGALPAVSRRPAAEGEMPVGIETASAP